jgi:class 3 adenylate cyclase
MAGEERECTALVVDLRDFRMATPGQPAAPTGDLLAEFVEEFYAECLRAARTVLGDRADSELVCRSQAGSVQLVFLGEGEHACHAYATALLLCRHLPRLCDSRHYASEIIDPIDRFGIGLEPGTARVIRVTDGASELVTLLGACVSVATQLERHTRMLARSPMLIGERVNDHLCARLSPGIVYTELVQQAIDPEANAPRAGLHKTMDALNGQLRLRFLTQIHVSGAPRPLCAFRFSPSLARGVDGIVELVAGLFPDDPVLVQRFEESYRA